LQRKQASHGKQGQWDKIPSTPKDVFSSDDEDPVAVGDTINNDSSDDDLENVKRFDTCFSTAASNNNLSVDEIVSLHGVLRDGLQQGKTVWLKNKTSLS
jgi:hypothetical protein